MRSLAEPAVVLLCIILKLHQPQLAHGSPAPNEDWPAIVKNDNSFYENNVDCLGEICQLPASTGSAEEKLPPDIKTTVDKILRFLDEGEQRNNNNNAPNNSILILGLTGTGKSTFSQFIAGNNDDLISEENDSGQYIIKDEDNKISYQSTILSQTVYSDLIGDEERNVGFYDCPGFSDTRSVTNDISSTYFIKKIIDNSRGIKLIFTVSEHQVVADLDRSGFMQFLVHATTMIKNIHKFNDSIGLVVTKVTNYEIRHGKIINREDGDIIRSITRFLTVAKRDLNELKEKWTTLYDPNFFEKAIALIDIFLTKDGCDKYTKIGIFRRPNASGKISQIKLLQDGKHLLENLVHKKLNYYKHNGSEDFGYTISSESKLYVNGIKQALVKKIEGLFVVEASKKIEERKNKLIEEINNIIQAYLTKGVVNEKKNYVIQISENYKLLIKTLNNLLVSLKDSKHPGKAIDEINIMLQRLGIDTVYDTRELRTQLQFFDSLSNKNSTCDWGKNFDSILKNAFYVEAHIKSDITRIKDEIVRKIDDNYNNACEKSKLFYDEKLLNYEIGKFQNDLNVAITNISNTRETIKRFDKFLYKDIFTSIESLGITYVEKYKFENEKLETYRDFFYFYDDNGTPELLLTNLTPFESLSRFVVELFQWCEFLDKIYVDLSTYEFQQQRSKYAASLTNLGREENTSIYSFIHVFPEYKSLIENITVTNSKNEALRSIIKSILHDNIVLVCDEPDELIVKGDLVKFSDFINSDGRIRFVENCGEIRTLNVFALNNIFIDRNIINDKQIQIFLASPKWEVIENRAINLEGKTGDQIDPPKAISHIRFGQDGESGRNGSPGGPGGSLSGFAHEIVHSENLYISINGGNGGPGQDGGDGGYATQQEGKNIIADSNFLLGFYYDREIEHIISGGRGGDGGRPGNGGVGGPAGNISIVTFVKNSVSVSQINGQVGKTGKGGKGGNSTSTETWREGEKCIIWFFCWSKDPEKTYVVHRAGYEGIVPSDQEIFAPVIQPSENKFTISPESVEKYRDECAKILTHTVNPKPYIEFVGRLTNFQDDSTNMIGDDNYVATPYTTAD